MRRVGTRLRAGLSARRIVAVWLGSYRLVMPVTLLTAAVAAFHSGTNYVWGLAALALLPYVLCVAAAWSALGVVMGLWFSPRFAAVLTAAFFAIGLCGPPMMSVASLEAGRQTGSGWAVRFWASRRSASTWRTPAGHLGTPRGGSSVGCNWTAWRRSRSWPLPHARLSAFPELTGARQSVRPAWRGVAGRRRNLSRRWKADHE